MIFEAMGDVIFHLGEAAAGMIIINTGSMKYTRGHEDEDVFLSVGTWVSEAILWTDWAHRGALVAAGEHCRCFKLSAVSFQETVNQFALTDFDPTKYAEALLDTLNNTDMEEVSDLPMTIDA